MRSLTYRQTSPAAVIERAAELLAERPDLADVSACVLASLAVSAA
jgi:hypothetical protein